MELKHDTIERIIREALAQMSAQGIAGAGVSVEAPASSMSVEALASGKTTERDPFLVSIGVSNRHIHLSRTDMDALFGPGSQLTRKKAMKQPGQFAAEETVTLKGRKGSLTKVRVLGPLRKETQIEVSVADGFTLGITPPLRMSGHLDDTPGVEIIGPQGSVQRDRGVIVALRHIHMPPETAALLGLRNGEEVDVEVGGERGGVLRKVVVRAAEASAYEMHIDVEEANALCLKNDDLVRIRKI
ncbi:phosphate propanoyltransferase [Rhodospirillum rubrum]|uniref:phosphate propanoyltransferase n=1 Tax=Rhodospirillum rubrum TaxID=1085 RepID=UPI001908CF01|nr:phosphate propanoyltransferase [Rhodospirillum rubrum]MBK1664609.1 phosphate propanoyltransferase [Rhodospirillum rubrum]MBK1677240.1 phosphate propanoyltransferase [Rhodospirillum rubrum]